MNDLRYEAPDTLDAAVALLAGASGVTRVLAGGTDVIVQMYADMIEPELLVDIKKIPELRTIGEEAGGWRFGAAVTCMELIEHAAFCKAWPGVIEGVDLIGSIQVMGRATVAGNLCNASPAADSVPAMIAAEAVAGHSQYGLEVQGRQREAGSQLAGPVCGLGHHALQADTPRCYTGGSQVESLHHGTRLHPPARSR